MECGGEVSQVTSPSTVLREPGRYTLTAEAHIEQLTESTINANARFFASRDEVPTSAITMGMADILAAKKIVLMANGPAKADAIRGLIGDGRITTQNPSTLLKLHPDVVVVIEEELAKAAGWQG